MAMQQFLLLLYYSASGTIKPGINVSDPYYFYVDSDPASEENVGCCEDPDPKYCMFQPTLLINRNYLEKNYLKIRVCLYVTKSGYEQFEKGG